MELVTFFIEILACLAVANLGNTRKIGKVRALNICLLFTPIVGILAVLISEKNTN